MTDYIVQENEDGTQFVDVSPEDLNEFIAKFEFNEIPEIDDSFNKSLNFVEMTIDGEENEVTKFNFAVADLTDETPFNEMQDKYVKTNPFREFEDAPLEEEEDGDE